MRRQLLRCADICICIQLSTAAAAAVAATTAGKQQMAITTKTTRQQQQEQQQQFQTSYTPSQLHKEPTTQRKATPTHR